jgi:serine/threonine-protein kinase
MPSTHRLRLLGGASVETDAGPVTGPIAQRRRLALLALLAASPGGAMSRDRLAAYLFPDADTARAHGALSDALHAVRRALGREAIQAVGDELRLDSTLVPSDVAEFERAAAAGEHERAAGLYGGAFLDGFSVPDAGEFERWMEDARQRLAQQYARALEAAAEARETRGDAAGSVEWWQRFAQHDPYSSRVAVRLCRALEARGDPAGALRHARLHAARLREELGVEPGPDVVALVERVRRGADADRTRVPDASSAVPEMVAAPATPDAPAGAPPPGPRPQRRAVWATGVGAALAAGVLMAALADGRRPRAMAPPPAPPAPPAVPAPRSVAVLRFRNIGDAREDRYFADGMSEEIIQTLARLDGVHVASRGSSFALSTDTLTARDVGRRLGVETLVEGGVRRAGARLRVSVRLVDAADGYTRWSETFDRPAADVFAVQEAIARAIAGALRVRLADGRSLIAPHRTTDPQTYDHYLRGRYLWWNAPSEEGARESVREFDRALARDSAFAPAWVGLADAYFRLTAYHDVAPGAATAPARSALRRALALDSTLADVHAGLGYLHTFHDLDWPAAESHFRRALALDPRHGRAHLYYAWMLAARGRHAEALGAILRARSLDPLDPRIAVRAGTMRYLAGDFAGAAEECRRVAEQNRDFPLAHRQLGEALAQQPGRAEAGVAALRRAAALWPTTETRARLAYGLARAGAAAEARRLLAALERGAAQAYVSPYERARVHVGLGEPDRALALLERAYDAGTSALVLVAVDPAFAPLRAEPRFRALLTRLGLAS